ncbi:MAG: VWA domain-containing protein [Chitinophagaceae bacterium]|nr:VWA domain-containing protein [Chitinophagaceae bacterium]
MRKIRIAFLLLAGCLAFSKIFAQAGTSSASLSMNRANQIIASDQVVIEEYVNYHLHQIPIPKNDEKIAMELRWGNSNISNQANSAILQIGIATKQTTDFNNFPPVNICLVIDKSGSMASDQKLEKVKKSLLKFIKGLRSEDIISIIAYDSEASVLYPAQNAVNKESIEGVIESLIPGSSTNLDGGMVLGYQEVLKNYDSKYTNRVILLTDGIANAGETDPEKIVKNSKSFNARGIEISTIGVGSDINYTLLKQISKIGKGLNHFVGRNKEDIEKVFVDELASLYSSIAKNPYLEIEIPENLIVEEIAGYQPTYKGKTILIPLDNMNAGLTQVVLVKYKMKELDKERPTYPLAVNLFYNTNTDSTGKKISQSSVLNFSASSDKINLLANDEVKKNYIIAQLAINLKKMAKLKEDGKDKEALEVGRNTLKQIAELYPCLKDKDIIRVKDIFENNYNKIKNDPSCNCTNGTFLL